MPTPFARLLRSRIDAGLTIPILAERIGVGEHAVRGWLRGEYAPAASRLADVALTLDLPLSVVVMAANGFEGGGVKP